MKNQFAQYMLAKNFSKAAELIFDRTLIVKVPENVNLKINIDRQSNIDNLRNQMESCYNRIDESFSEVSFDNLWTNVFTNSELAEKQNLKDDNNMLDKAKTLYDKAMNKFRIQQFEQIFESITLALNTNLQSVVDDAVRI